MATNFFARVDRRRLVAQTGGPMMGFIRHLVYGDSGNSEETPATHG